MIKIKYRRAVIKVDARRQDFCSACRRESPKIDYHHWKKEFPTDKVKKNSELVLLNTTQLCYPCHQAADGIVKLLKIAEKDLPSAGSLLLLMPHTMRNLMLRLCLSFQLALTTNDSIDKR